MAKRFRMLKALKAPKSKTVKRAVSRSKITKSSRPKPRQRQLPETGQIRNGVLDELCEEYADGREKINKLTVREKGIKSEALQEMTRTGGKVYKHAGAVFQRTPGADKLNARLTKDDGDAGDDALDASTEAANEADETSDARMESQS